MNKKWTYKEAGVNIECADEAKTEMAAVMAQQDSRILNKPGAFASLFQADFKGMERPVLVMKAEEPGSKQQLAFQYGKIENICYDLINHLVNDIIVMGAKPEAVLDTILCGKLERDTVVNVVRYMAQACREHDCTLIGGETSEQPGVLADGQYMLNASVLGVVDRDKIIDGSRISAGDTVLALPSNGLHTNGYSLIRKLIDANPGILEQAIDGESFLDAILKPHQSYYRPLKPLFGASDIHGLAHITGGGIAGNLIRILPEGTRAIIDLSQIDVLPLIKTIRSAMRLSDEVMLQTFNIGVGMTLVAAPEQIPFIKAHLKKFDCHAYEIGHIEGGERRVEFINRLNM